MSEDKSPFAPDLVFRHFLQQQPAPVIPDRRVLVGPLEDDAPQAVKEPTMTTETAWLASDDPKAMLTYILGYPDGLPGGSALPRRISDRKLRLFACACCRQVWHLLTDKYSREAVEVAERFADGLVGDQEREGAFYAARQHWAVNTLVTESTLRQLPPNRPNPWGRLFEECGGGLATLLRDVAGNPLRPIWWADDPRKHARPRYGPDDLGDTTHRHPGKIEMRRAWLTPDVLRLARLAYDNRTAEGRLDPLALLALADALEEAGCGEHAILAHLRGFDCPGHHGLPCCGGTILAGDGTGPCPTCKGSGVPSGPHVRGCWAVDLILGKG